MLLNKMPGMHIKGHVTFKQARFYWRWCSLMIEYITGSQNVILVPFRSVKKCLWWKRAPHWNFFSPQHRLSALSLPKNKTLNFSLCCTSVMLAMQWTNIHDSISKDVHSIQMFKKSNSSLLFATVLRNFIHLTQVTFDRKSIYNNPLSSIFLT